MNPTHAAWAWFPAGPTGPGWELVGLYLSRERAQEDISAIAVLRPGRILALTRCLDDGQAVPPPPWEVLRSVASPGVIFDHRKGPAAIEHLQRCWEQGR